MAWQSIESKHNAFDVVIIGAGISGINFAYRLQEKHPELSYIILEGRHEIGGTWSLFQYPGKDTSLQMPIYMLMRNRHSERL